MRDKAEDSRVVAAAPTQLSAQDDCMTVFEDGNHSQVVAGVQRDVFRYSPGGGFGGIHGGLCRFNQDKIP